MQTVIIQIEGEGAYRVPASRVPAHRAFVEAELKGRDFYVIDGCGRTWAPLPEGAYVLWEGSNLL